MLAYDPLPEHIDPDVLSKSLSEFDAQLSTLETGVHTRLSALPEVWRWYSAKAVIDTKKGQSPSKVAGVVDWAAWRIAFEYCMLYVRGGGFHGVGGGVSVRPPSSYTDVSVLLELALSLCLMHREDEAAALLRDTEEDLIQVIESMNMGRRKTPLVEGDLGVFGFLYDRLLGHIPDHPTLAYDASLLTPEGRAQILLAKRNYSRGNAGGQLLWGYAYKLIPLELIYVNECSAPELRDAGLSALATAIAATKYPDDARLIDCDRRLKALGI